MYFMTKKTLNQNDKYVQKFIDLIEPDFIFNNRPIDRFNFQKGDFNQSKFKQLSDLKNKIYSIQNCNLKENSKTLIFGNNEINSPIMLIGETPGGLEEKAGYPFQGEVGELLKKMVLAINLKKEKLYLTYSINFRPPEDRKPTSYEIKRYSVFLKEHISIINPKIIVLMGSSAMEAITGISEKITTERGHWKEVILKNKTFPLMITFNPSYLIRFPENKKHSWEDLKKIRDKIKDLKLKI